MKPTPEPKPQTPDTALPRWDLSALFPGADSPEFSRALNDIERDVKIFADTYRGQVARLPGAKLGAAVADYERLSENIARVEAYVDLLRAGDVRHDAFAAQIDARLRAASQDTLFFSLEINKISETDLLQKLVAPELAHYAPWLGGVRAGRAHQLTDAEEKYRHIKMATAEDAWRRLFDQTVTDMRFDIGGRKLTEAEALNIIDNAQDPAERRAAWDIFAKELAAHKKTFALITNTLIDLKTAEDTQRGFEKPEDSRHLENHIDRATVTALTTAVKDDYAQLSHRYYAWKAQKFGAARLHPADRNAPLPGRTEKYIPWDEAKQIVLDAFAKLSPEMAEIGKRFFDEGWIDAEPRAGKDSGGFSHPTVPSAHPYILLNYFGTAADVMTLAHELGHGIHQVLAAKQGHLMSDTPLTLAETASVFGEMLVFRSLLDREADPVERRAMIAGKIEDMLNTVVRQTAFFTFEQKIHEERRNGSELTPERLSDIWRDISRESLGPAVNMDVPGAGDFWMHVPHFIHTPFYVYAYAFGDCLVNALSDTLAKTPDKKDFADKYIDLLSAGGSKSHAAVLAPFGFDIDDPGFWKQGLSVIERYIDDLQKLDRKIDMAAKAQKDFKQAGDDIVTPPARNDNQMKPRRAAPKPPRASRPDGKPPTGAS